MCGKKKNMRHFIHFRAATEKKAFYFRHLGKTLPLLSQKGGGGRAEASASALMHSARGTLTKGSSI